MRKWICVAFTTLWVCLALASCMDVVEVEKAEAAVPPEPTSMFVVVERAKSWIVVYNVDTKVMYTVSNGAYNYGTFTLLVDADGNPMLYEEAD